MMTKKFAKLYLFPILNQNNLIAWSPGDTFRQTKIWREFPHKFKQNFF